MNGEKKEYKEYSNSLNQRIQEVLLNKSAEITKINEEVIEDICNKDFIGRYKNREFCWWG